MSVLNPFDTFKTTDTKGRTITVLEYRSVSKADAQDTYNALVKSGSFSDKVIVGYDETSVGFNLSYINRADASIAEKTGTFFTLIGIAIQGTGSAIKETIVNAKESFSLPGIWDDLKKIWAEGKSFLILLIVLLVILFIWRKT